MKCPQCGADLLNDAVFCTACGKKQDNWQALIQSARLGDQNAIAQLYNNTYNAVYHTVKSMIRDEDTVLDILQDSYIKGFQNLGQLQNPVQFQAWMKQIATNTAKNWLKKKKPVLFSELENEDRDMTLDFEDERTENLPDAVIDQKETTRLINEILDSLSDEQRLVVGMFYYEQLSVREIAGLLNCSENTVKSRLNYARKKIKTKVEDLEKRGTKLYSLAPVPFLLWLFRGMDAQAAEIPNAQILQTIQTASSPVLPGQPIKPDRAGAGTTKVTSDVARAGMGAAKTATRLTGKGFAMKVIAAIAALAIIGSAIGVVVHNHNSQSETPAPPVETQSGTPSESKTDSTALQDKATQAYEEIARTYYDLCSLSSDDYFANTEDYTSQYPDVNERVMSYFHNYKSSNFYRSSVDIDSNGVDEFFIGYGEGGHISIVDFYIYDGKNAVKAIDNNTLGDRSSLTLYADGTFEEIRSSGADSAETIYWKINSDGVALEKIETISENPVVAPLDWSLLAAPVHNEPQQSQTGIADEYIGTYLQRVEPHHVLEITSNHDGTYQARFILEAIDDIDEEETGNYKISFINGSMQTDAGDISFTLRGENLLAVSASTDMAGEYDDLSAFEETITGSDESWATGITDYLGKFTGGAGSISLSLDGDTLVCSTESSVGTYTFFYDNWMIRGNELYADVPQDYSMEGGVDVYTIHRDGTMDVQFADWAMSGTFQKN